MIAFGGRSREEVLKISACLEEHFPHSVAKAIVKQAEVENLGHKEEHAEVEYVVAHGILSKLYGENVLIGSEHFIFDDEGVSITDNEKNTINSEIEDYSAVYLAIGGRLAEMICINDTVRADARETLESLRTLGMKHIVMLTGDGKAAAKLACETLGITEYYAQILPEEKAAIVETLKTQGRTVIMVGDGINDSPALSSAHVSTAMKDGSDIIINDGGFISLTGDGREIANKIYERHELLTKYLIALGVSEETAAEDACRIEHVISEESFEKIKEHAEQNRNV